MRADFIYFKDSSKPFAAFRKAVDAIKKFSDGAIGCISVDEPDLAGYKIKITVEGMGRPWYRAVNFLIFDAMIGMPAAIEGDEEGYQAADAVYQSRKRKIYEKVETENPQLNIPA